MMLCYADPKDKWDKYIVGRYEPFEAIVGTVNGVDITLDMFNERLAEFIDRYEERYPYQPFNKQIEISLQDQAWDSLIDDIIIDNLILAENIQISEAEIEDRMYLNPPPELNENFSLQTNGVFDKNKYVDALDSNAEFHAILREYYSKTLLRERLRSKLSESKAVNYDSLEVEYAKEINSVSGKVIKFNNGKAGEVQVSEDEIMDDYLKDKETRYKKGPATRIKYIVIENNPSEEDYAVKKLQIDQIYNEIIAGGDFNQLAQLYSDDIESLENGGYSFGIGKGIMVPEFENAASLLKEDEISKPVKTTHGWHIIRCDSIDGSAKEPILTVSHILLRVWPSETTCSANYDKAMRIREQVIQYGIEEVADIYNLELIDSYMIQHDSNDHPDIIELQGLKRFIKTNPTQAVSGVLRNNDRNMVIAQIVEKSDSYYEEFEDASFMIKFMLGLKKENKIYETKAKEFVKKYKVNEYLKAAEKENLKIIEFSDFKESTRLDDIGASPDFTSAALALNKGECSGIVMTTSGPVIIIATERVKPDLKAFKKDLAVQKEIQDKIEADMYVKRLQEMKYEAEVVDYRFKHGL